MMKFFRAKLPGSVCRSSALFLLICQAILLTCAESRGQTPDDDSLRIQRHIKYLAGEELAGRRGVNARRAGDYIVQEFQKLNLEPVFPDQSFLQMIPGPPTEAGEKTSIGWNVAAVLKGHDEKLAEEYVLVAVHHDHLGSGSQGIFAGADDNASGVAMLLEMARIFAERPEPLPRSVLFISFDLEEHLLFGSRWFTAHPPVPLEQIKFVVVADMLGRSLGDMPLDAFFVFGSEHARGIPQALQKIPFSERCQPILLSDDFVGTRSDYGPFRDRQIPFIFVSTGQSRDYHTIRDTADKINFDQVATITRGLSQLVQQTAETRTPPEWIPDPQPDLAEVKSILKIVEQTEQHAEQWKLTPLQRLFVSQTRRQAEKILQKNELDENDRAWLTRSTQLLLFSVF